MSDNHLKNAKDLLAIGVGNYRLYVCLELRMAIEYHVYKKLEFYSKRYGTKLLYNKWQPNKALKLLCQLEPNSDKPYTVRAGKQNKLGEPATDLHAMGHHETLSTSWVTKNYNKLGSYLHIQMSSMEIKPISQDYLDTIISELERVEKGSIISSITEVSSTDCNQCGEKIISCTNSLAELHKVVCPNPKCYATYSVEKSGESWVYRLNSLDFSCSECEEIIPILMHEISIGMKLNCKKCKSKYEVYEQNWEIRKLNG